MTRLFVNWRLRADSLPIIRPYFARWMSCGCRRTFPDLRRCVNEEKAAGSAAFSVIRSGVA
jgi:hypothetical protein